MTTCDTPDDTRPMVEAARDVIGLNIQALQALSAALDERIAQAVRIILGRDGYVVVTGMGKSGHIGGKIAATLASTGTNAFFVHPAEMSHGDLGMLRGDVTLLAISNSGESRELRDPLLFCQRNDIPVIGITQRRGSFLERMSTVSLMLPKVQEACPNNLAPTTSTLMTLAIGDALAMVLMKERGFSAEDFGARHPGGALGMRLQSVREWMQLKTVKPATVAPTAAFAEVVSSITRGRQGCVAVTGADGLLVGMITDGDVRRAFSNDISGLTAADMMNPRPKTVGPDQRMSEVIDMLADNHISNLFVVEDGRPVAVAHIGELILAGYVS